jgi:hypothetical protein
MKCPYCSQEHPDETSLCPETGESLAQFAWGESTQGGQLPKQPEIEFCNRRLSTARFY